MTYVFQERVHALRFTDYLLKKIGKYTIDSRLSGIYVRLLSVSSIVSTEYLTKIAEKENGKVFTEEELPCG